MLFYAMLCYAMLGGLASKFSQPVGKRARRYSDVTLVLGLRVHQSVQDLRILATNYNKLPKLPGAHSRIVAAVMARRGKCYSRIV
jgi:hypothetical protein